MATTFADWLLADIRVPEAKASTEHSHPWWQVMCLTGVDYFSSLGYAPGIAFLAAGALSPLATLILVIVTLFAALPAYCRVARASPNGQGSIAMLERLFPGWRGKIFVLILLGFATTDFVITMTLSSADAAAHLIENPFFPKSLDSQMGATLVILAILGGIFLRGFTEAIGIAVGLVAAYLALNAVVVVVALERIREEPTLFTSWEHSLFTQHGSPLQMLGFAILLFPRLALGLSGFETGVAVMPLIRARTLAERVKNTRKLLATAAVIMSVFLLTSSFTTTILIPAREFRPGGSANGRAIAWLAHRYLGNTFGTLYDFSTILILGFAGASAMAGLLSLVPRYLPRYGMAPEWARASRPLVLVFVGVAFTVTILFRADVDAQGGAYATGVLVLMTSGAIAVALGVWKSSLKWYYGAVALVFIYTTATNIYERPEGIKIASVFIVTMICTSLISRVLRAVELRVSDLDFDQEAVRILAEDEDQIIRFIAHNPRDCRVSAYDETEQRIREIHNLSRDEKLIFVEVQRTDTSDFEAELVVKGEHVDHHCVLRTSGPSIPNALAAVLIWVTDHTERRAHMYFKWPEGNPFNSVLRFIFLGDGYTAPLTEEILRQAIPDPENRPLVHVV
jgi:hypothetical protein